MLVKLPRKTKGDELLDAIQDAVDGIRKDGYGIKTLGFVYRYECKEGSVERIIVSHSVDIMREEKTREGFFKRGKEVVKGYYCPQFSFPEVFIDEKYSELDIGVYTYWVAASNKTDASGEEFEWISSVFEKLLAGIYKKIGSKLPVD